MESLSPKLIKSKIIEPVLEMLEIDGDNCVQAMELLLGTAAAESGLKPVKQIGGGPALGLWQIEPLTEIDTWQNYLAYRPKLRGIVEGWRTKQQDELVWNHSYACAIARIKYLRVPVKLPAAGDLKGQAAYWKRWYNTYLGKGTPEHYSESWKAYVEGKL